jgi:hypothetical protein
MLDTMPIRVPATTMPKVPGNWRWGLGLKSSIICTEA